MRSRLSFRWKIFAFYAFFVSLLIIGLSVSSYIYFSNAFTRNAFNGMDQSVKRISQQTDTFLSNMNDMTKIVLYNRSLQDILLDALSSPSEDQNYFDIELDQKKKVNELLFSLMGTKDIPRRVKIFNGKYNMMSLSTLPDSVALTQTDLQVLPWIPSLRPSDVYYITLPPHRDGPNSSIFVLSFIRKISNTASGNDLTLGYVEVQQPYSMIEDIVKPSLFKHASVYILDDKDRIVYPIGKSEPTDALLYLEKSRSSGSALPLRTKNPHTGKSELIYRTVSASNGWTVLQVMNQGEFTGPIRKFQIAILLTSLLLLVFTLILMYFISASLTAPIRRLHQSLKNVTLQNPSLKIDFEGSPNEITWFTTALNKTMQRLQESMKQTIEARSKEVQAHFQALQAQIDPHFLYNTLMGISAVAQEDNNPKIVEMCVRLSRMLRYAGSFDSPIVEMAEEIQYVENYIRLFKFRYEDNLEFDCTLDEGIGPIRIPKLVLQPLIENCFSHGFTGVRPPYRLKITGSITAGNRWTLTVSDNGIGFSQEALDRIRKRIERYDRSLRSFDYENKLEVGGMAIFNVYVRLKMIYQEQLLFDIHNNETGGASVTIGGIVQ